MILLDKKYKYKNEQIVLIYENVGRFLRGIHKVFGFKKQNISNTKAGTRKMNHNINS